MDDTRLVHEAEVQRQFVRVRIPAEVVLDGHCLEVYDWSVDGLSVYVDSNLPDQSLVHTGTIKFKFGDFDMSVEFSAEVRHISSVSVDGKDRNRIGLQFLDLPGRSRSLLRFVASAYLTGEVVTSGDILNLAKRENFTKPRKSKKKGGEGLSRTKRIYDMLRTPASWAVLATIVIFATVMTGSAFYRNAYVRQLATAEVMTDTPTARAPVSGVITFIAGAAGDQLAIGEPLLGVRRPSGEEVFVDSPCECKIVSVEHSEREFIESGEVILRMLHPNSKTFVRLYVTKSNAPWLFEYQPDTMSARVLGQDGEFELSLASSVFDEAREMVVLDLVSSTDIPPELAGRPATVILEAGGSSWFSAVRNFFR